MLSGVSRLQPSRPRVAENDSRSCNCHISLQQKKYQIQENGQGRDRMAENRCQSGSFLNGHQHSCRGSEAHAQHHNHDQQRV